MMVGLQTLFKNSDSCSCLLAVTGDTVGETQHVSMCTG